MILLDSNQASMDVELKNHLEKHVDILVTPLDTSDLFFVGKINGTQIKVGMELKKAPSDLMASLRDGRLMTQLPRMTQEFDMPYLVTIGEAEKIDFTEGKVQEKLKVADGVRVTSLIIILIQLSLGLKQAVVGLGMLEIQLTL